MQTFVIGRDAGNQIVLNDKLVSRQHAHLIVLDNGQVVIKDLGSSNGTFVNGNRITETQLNPGDIVKCGPIFLNWAQYAGTGSQYQHINYQQPVAATISLDSPEANTSESQYNFGDVFKYLTSRIFEIGDLFKTNWNRNSSILILNSTPALVTLIASIIIYSKYSASDFYFFPTILVACLFTVCPFLTVFLLSLTRKAAIDKVALASGIIGFIQFAAVLCYVIYLWIRSEHIRSSFGNYFFNRFESRTENEFLIIVSTLLLAVFLVNLVIAFYLFIYKYFISIGVDRSKAIYLIVKTFALTLFFQILASYLVYLIAKDNVINYNF